MSALIGLFSGIISGMGIGGGAVLIPALMLTSGVEQKLAQGINLVYFIPTALVALVIHIKNKKTELKTALIIGISGIVGAVIGSVFAMKINNDTLKYMFGIFLGIIGLCEIFKGIKTKSQKGR